jgi:hypothetical protein
VSNNYEQLLEASLREFRHEVEHQVECELEARRANGVTKLPWIDGSFDPLAPPEQHAEQKQRIIRALLARKRFESEAKYLQPLPLCEQERILFNNSGDRRLQVVAAYSMRLQGSGWHYQWAGTFFDFIQQSA